VWRGRYADAAHIDAAAGAEVRRPEVIEEDERTHHARLPEGKARCTVKSPRSTERGTITCAMAADWTAFPGLGVLAAEETHGNSLLK